MRAAGGRTPSASARSPALKSKTSTTKETQTRFIPYVALGSGLAGTGDWGARWLKARRKQRWDRLAEVFLPSQVGTQAPGGERGDSLPARRAAGSRFLQGGGQKSHSLKATLLTFAARSHTVRFEKADQRLLGHHAEPGDRSMLVYSREAFTTLYGKVLAMFESIQSGRFDPDLAAPDRILAVAAEETPGAAPTTPVPEAARGITGNQESLTPPCSDSEASSGHSSLRASLRRETSGSWFTECQA